VLLPCYILPCYPRATPVLFPCYPRATPVQVCAKKFIVIVDESKLCDGLGPGFPLPVEITPFCWEHTMRTVAALPSVAGCEAKLRLGSASTGSKVGPGPTYPNPNPNPHPKPSPSPNPNPSPSPNPGPSPDPIPDPTPTPTPNPIPNP